MKKFKNYLIEKKITVYHGDRHNTKKLDVKLMNNGNNQEGIGIYFSDNIEDTKTYGKDVVSASINTNNFINSHDDIAVIGNSKIEKILKDLFKLDEEEFYYLITDYGVEVHNPEDVNENYIKELVNLIKNEEVRNFQIDLSDRFGVKQFVDIWNKITKIDGTFQKQNGSVWYSVINPKIKLTQEK